MNAKRLIFFNALRTPRDAVDELLRTAGVMRAADEPVWDGNYVVELPEDAPELDRLRLALTRAGLPSSERLEIDYTTADLVAAPLLRIVVEEEERLDAAVDSGVAFPPRNGCQRCGTGAEPGSALVVDERRVPRRPVFATVAFEIVVDEAVALDLEKKLGTGLVLRPVRSRKGRVLPYRQLWAQRPLPAMAPETEGLVVEDQCPLCRRDGHFESADEPLRIRYRRDAVGESLDDVMRTWEHFGNSMRRDDGVPFALAQPLLVFRPHVLSVLDSERLAGARLEPVEILESPFIPQSDER